MRTKLIASTVGLLLLGGSALALAGGRDDHAARYQEWHADAWHGHRGHGFDRHPHRAYYYGPRHFHDLPRPYVYRAPAPVWHHGHPGPGYRGAPPQHDRDGVSIILRGHFN